MFSRFLWRPLTGAVLVTLPALALIPGCGGGGGSNSGGGNKVVLYSGVQLVDDDGAITKSNLSVTYSATTLTTQNVTGYLLVLSATSATPTPTTTATTTTAAQIQQRHTRSLPENYKPSAATYQVQGTVTLPSVNADPVVNLHGAFDPRRAFTISGAFSLNEDPNHPFILTSTFVRPNVPTESGTLQLKAQPIPYPIDPAPTSIPTTASTPTTTSTPSGTATATPIA